MASPDPRSESLSLLAGQAKCWRLMADLYDTQDDRFWLFTECAEAVEEIIRDAAEDYAQRTIGPRSRRRSPKAVAEALAGVAKT